MTNLHPVFSDIFRTTFPHLSVSTDPVVPSNPPVVTDAERIATYVRALRAHDWDYEYSDDGSVWRRGRDERAALERMRPELDPDYLVWDAHAPTSYRRSRA